MVVLLFMKKKTNSISKRLTIFVTYKATITKPIGGKSALSKTVLNMQKIGCEAVERKLRLKKKPTRAEMAFREILKNLEIHFGFQKLAYLPHRYYILDFVIGQNPKLIVEIDGDSHINREKEDKQRENNILTHRKYRKYKFLRFTNEQVFNGEAEKVMCKKYNRKPVNLEISSIQIV